MEMKAHGFITPVNGQELYRDIIDAAGKAKQHGVTTFWNIKKKEDDLKAGKHIPLASRKRVQEFLEQNLVITGPLNGSKALVELNVEDQCKFFEKFPQCETLILQSWKAPISDLTLRTISMTMADRLLELDMSYSSVDTATLDVILLHFTRLRTVKFSHCPRLDGLAMGLMSKLNGPTVKELFVDHCEQFKLEPLLALAGQIGVGGGGLRKLRVLDLGACPVDDRGLVGIGRGCQQLRFLNLQECRDVTDVGIIGVVETNPHLQLLNLAGCQLITDKSARCIARSCPHLTSINLSLCAKLTNKGIKAIAACCPNLQVANFAGIVKLSEGSLVDLASNCPGLLMLNVTGCEAITPNGLKALITGLKYVEAGVSFSGFKPKDQHVEQKLTDHLSFLRGRAIQIIGEGFEKHRLRKEAALQAQMDRMERAAMQIQGSFRRYMQRMYFYAIYMRKKRAACATKLQSLWRGRKGRRRAYAQGVARRDFYSRTPQAVQVQKMVRGYIARLNNLQVARAVVLMYSQRWQEAQVAMYIRLQAFGRRFLVHRKVRIMRELRSRRRLDERYAAIIVQTNTRAFLARVRVMRMRFEAFQIFRMRKRAARVIETWYYKAMRRVKDFLEGKDMISQVRRLKRQVFLMMRVARGFLGRERAARIKIQRALHFYAATSIQRIFRGSRVLHWKDLRMNVIAAYILDRHNIERRDREYDSRMKYHRFIVDNRKDSASEDDEKLEDIRKDVMSSFNWVKSYDYRRQCDFWTNLVDGEIVYEQPFLPYAHETYIVGFKARIYWPVQREWYEGTLWRFNMRKRRHKVVYDDGDYEWMDLKREEERVQLLQEDGTWIMYSLYQSPEMVRVRGVKERSDAGDEVRRKAYADARQWKLLRSDKGTFEPGSEEAKRILFFISERNGVIRAGTQGAEDWEIQDDGHGFPRFYNVVTKEKVYDDPRFEEEESKAMDLLRAYVLDEIRFCMFFCRELWEAYCAAKQAYDEEQAERTLSIHTRLQQLGIDVSEADNYDPAALLGELEEEDDEPYLPATAPNPAVHPHLKPRKKPVKKEHPGLKLRAVNQVLARLKKSPKPKQLAALVMAAKGLHKTLSVVDRPVSRKANAEIAYAQFIAERLAVLQDTAFFAVMALKDKRNALLDKLTQFSGKPLYCPYCKYETKAHLAYCATCGRKQGLFLRERPPKFATSGKSPSTESLAVLERTNDDDDIGGGGGGASDLRMLLTEGAAGASEVVALSDEEVAASAAAEAAEEQVRAAAADVINTFFGAPPPPEEQQEQDQGGDDLALPPTLQHQFDEES